MSELFYNAKNLIVSNGFLRNPDRYYLEEFFEELPNVSAMSSNNTKFMVSKTIGGSIDTSAVTNSQIKFSTTFAGLEISPIGTIANDNIIIEPHSNTNLSPWREISWGTDREIEWECALSLDNINDVCLWAGLKLTNVANFSSNVNQAYFFYDSGTVVGNGTSMTNKPNLHFCYSINGAHYVTDLGITAEANISYRLRISIDSNRNVSVFVNEVQYGLTNTQTSTGLTVSNDTQKSLQLTNVLTLKPYVGLQQITATVKKFFLSYEKISRLLEQTAP